MLASDAGGSRAALVLTAVLLVAISLAGARRAEAAGAAILPPPPAVYTAHLAAVTKIQGDSFQFEWEGRTMTIRLQDADSSDLDPTRRQSAAFLAAQQLEAEPFWIFPCAPLNPGAPGEVRARVWTKKGWLSEILIKSNLAKRRSDAAAVTFTPAEAPSAAAPADVLPPPPPAFAATIQEVVAGDTFQVQREGETVRLRLYDATCEGSADRAKELAAQTLGTGPVWIFPSSQRKLDAGNDLPVRIWTARGWLADVLVAASAGNYYADPDKALAERLPAPPLQERAKPASAAEPKSGGPMTPKFVWHRVSVTVAKKSTHGMETALFTIPSSEWRLSWDLDRVMKRLSILVNIFYVDPEFSEVQQSTKPMGGFNGDRGSAVFHHKPGQYYLHIAGAKELNVKVEYSQKE
jgi:endonuclease YncB( thermonuclease family)